LFKRNKSRRAGKIVLPSRRRLLSVLRGMNPRSRFFSTKPACPPSRSARKSRRNIKLGRFLIRKAGIQEKRIPTFLFSVFELRSTKELAGIASNS
jgi:hypothetical protein